MKLFIDIDGTITSKALESGPEARLWGLKEGVGEFFDWATSKFDCYWLSNWVPRGSMFNFNRSILPLLPESVKLVKPAYFEDLKTEAIVDGDFFWLDDNLLSEEKKYLEDHGWLNGFIHVDRNGTSMAPVVAEIEKRMHPDPEGMDE